MVVIREIKFELTLIEASLFYSLEAFNFSFEGQEAVRLSRGQYSTEDREPYEDEYSEKDLRHPRLFAVSSWSK